MKKYLSVILGIILTACLVACGSSNKDSVNDDKQEVINNQEVVVLKRVYQICNNCILIQILLMEKD